MTVDLNKLPLLEIQEWALKVAKKLVKNNEIVYSREIDERIVANRLITEYNYVGRCAQDNMRRYSHSSLKEICFEYNQDTKTYSAKNIVIIKFDSEFKHFSESCFFTVPALEMALGLYSHFVHKREMFGILKSNFMNNEINIGNLSHCITDIYFDENSNSLLAELEVLKDSKLHHELEIRLQRLTQGLIINHGFIPEITFIGEIERDDETNTNYMHINTIGSIDIFMGL